MFGWYHFLKSQSPFASCVYHLVKSIKTMGGKEVREGKRSIQNEKSDEEKSKKQKLGHKGHWANGLYTAMENPNLKVDEDDLVIVIKDMYPKAEHHYLVIPKDDIASLKDLKETHISLLTHMHEVAKKLAKDHQDREFKIGYHAQPSMAPLHLHVISDDFNSPSLKTKKHWNSFTTEFFLPCKDVIDEIKTNGGYTQKPAEELKDILLRNLKCHKCSFESKTIPALKNHVSQTHFAVTKGNENNHVIFDN